MRMMKKKSENEIEKILDVEWKDKQGEGIDENGET